jgi:hypothetical protein
VALLDGYWRWEWEEKKVENEFEIRAGLLWGDSPLSSDEIDYDLLVRIDSDEEQICVEFNSLKATEHYVAGASIDVLAFQKDGVHVVSWRRTHPLKRSDEKWWEVEVVGMDSRAIEIKYITLSHFGAPTEWLPRNSGRLNTVNT